MTLPLWKSNNLPLLGVCMHYINPVLKIIISHFECSSLNISRVVDMQYQNKILMFFNDFIYEVHIRACPFLNIAPKYTLQILFRFGTLLLITICCMDVLVMLYMQMPNQGHRFSYKLSVQHMGCIHCIQSINQSSNQSFVQCHITTADLDHILELIYVQTLNFSQ